MTSKENKMTTEFLFEKGNVEFTIILEWDGMRAFGRETGGGLELVF